MERSVVATSSAQVGYRRDLRLRERLSPAAAPAVLLVVAAAWAAARGIDHRFISFSDGVYLYAASQAAAHGLNELYGTIALSLPPGTPVLATLLWKLSPHIETVRVAVAVMSSLTAFLTYRAARSLFGLRRETATLAAVLALAGPVHAQFVGVEGETFLTPLALGLALALNSERDPMAVVLLGLGLVFKLTWAPFFLAGVLLVGVRAGWRRALGVGLAGSLLSGLVYVAMARSFGWSARELLAQLLLAESHSGWQLGLAAGISLAVLVMWWPGLVLAPAGLRGTSRSARYVMAAALVSSVSMVKQGTFFNVLDPLEPFLAMAAVAGGCALWRGSAGRRALVVFCTAGAVVHAVGVSGIPGSRAIPLSLSAAIVDTQNEGTVNRIARAIDAHSRPDEPVLVSPFFALVADRHEPLGATDWFILRALERSCAGRPGGSRHCGDWQDAKAAKSAVVSVDSNVVSFDPSFRRSTGSPTMRRLIKVDAPP
ncbi:MAG TPA: hypothetical protein VIU81_05865, partial [Gaiellaceae bacterium]